MDQQVISRLDIYLFALVGNVFFEHEHKSTTFQGAGRFARGKKQRQILTGIGIAQGIAGILFLSSWY